MHRVRPFVAFAFALSLLSACVQRPPLVVQTATGEIVPLEAWTADLVANARVDSGALTGSVSLLPGNTVRETQALVTLQGGSPNAVHPWFVQMGACDNDLGILAGQLAYPPIALDGNGNARVSFTLPFTPPTSGHYFVTVRRSEREVSTVVACGNLVKATDSSTLARGYANTGAR
jgi:hypothetical protein